MLDQTKEIITEMEEIEWGITSKEKLKNIYTTFFIGHDKNIVQFDLKRNQDKYLEILKRIILTRSFVVENWVDSEEKDDDDDDDDSLDIDYLSKRKRTPKLIKKKKKKTIKIDIDINGIIKELLPCMWYEGTLHNKRMRFQSQKITEKNNIKNRNNNNKWRQNQ